MKKNIKKIIGVFLLIFILAAPIMLTTTGDEDPKPLVNNTNVMYNV